MKEIRAAKATGTEGEIRVDWQMDLLSVFTKILSCRTLPIVEV